MKKSKFFNELTTHLLLLFIVEVVIIIIGWLIHRIFNMSGEESFFAFLQLEMPVWVLLLVAPFLYVIIRKFTKTTATTKDYPEQETSTSEVYFKSDKSSYFDYDFQQLQNWNNELQKNEGEPAQGKCRVDNSIVTITRLNTKGRLVLRISKYNINGQPKEYIDSSSSKAKRNIEVEFEVRITDEPISLRIIIQPNNNYEWKAKSIYKIDSKDWQKFLFQAKIESHYNFIVRFEDYNCNKLPCEYLIRNIIIRELK